MPHRCDFCQLSDEPIERCGFGENGFTLMLHAPCQETFRALSRKEQNDAIDEAKRCNWREIKRLFQQ
jgi:hypothetical protein